MINLEFIKLIMPEIEKYFIKNGSTYTIPKEYDYFKESITLFAKQNNLIESIILLMEAGMNEEAYVLARSVLNNYFLIRYILEDKSKVEEYKIQPLITEMKYWKKVKESLKGNFGTRMKQQGKCFSFNEVDIDKKINDINDQIISSGVVDTKGRPVKNLLSIIDLAGKPEENSDFELYITYYMEASKYEHSDISALKIYRTQEEIDDLGTSTFIMNTNQTDTKLEKKIKFIIDNCYFQSFRYLVLAIQEIANKDIKMVSCYDTTKLLEISEKTLNYLLSLKSND